MHLEAHVLDQVTEELHHLPRLHQLVSIGHDRQNVVRVAPCQDLLARDLFEGIRVQRGGAKILYGAVFVLVGDPPVMVDR